MGVYSAVLCLALLECETATQTNSQTESTAAWATSEEDNSHLYAPADGSECPALQFTHLLKAGGNSVIGLMEKAKICDGTCMDAPVLVNATGHMYDSAARLGSYPRKQIFKIGLVRSPCDYLMSVWAFQRHSNDKHAACPHAIDVCHCLSTVLTAGDHERNYRPLDQGNRGGMCFSKHSCGTSLDQSNTFTEEQLAAERMHFSKWIHITAGKKIHFLSLRFWGMMSHEAWWRRDWCPAKLALAREIEIQKLVASEAEQSLHYNCMLRTETMFFDFMACIRAWVTSCSNSNGARDKLQHYFEHVFSREDWRDIKENVGRHENCSDFISLDDQAFIWEREQALAVPMGYKRCCYKAS